MSAMESSEKKEEETKSLSNILDIPDEILRKIILHLNARERMPLGNSCRRFHSLVFQDKELLRDLDFSEEVRSTSITDIQQYFNEEDRGKHVLRLNVRNIECLRIGRVLINSIGKPTNLVDINIHGIQFENIWRLAAFLNPLIHLQRLSVDWPEMEESHIPVCFQILEKPFSRLVYLSVKIMMHLLKVFIPSLRLCHKLRELCMAMLNPNYCGVYEDFWGGEIKELKNLETAQYCGPFAIEIKKMFATLLSEPEKWMDFELNAVGDPKNSQLGGIGELCEDLLVSNQDRITLYPEWKFTELGWVLVRENLFKGAMISHENLPEEFCRLSTLMDAKRCLLKLKDIKGLLRNPGHQVSYVFMNHAINITSDVHLIASAFRNLTELILCAITKNLGVPLSDTNLQRRKRLHVSAASEEEYGSLNLDTCFEILVENTLDLKHFTLDGSARCNNCDLNELYLIPRWKYLQTLCLVSIPIEDGNFLIEIGKKCKNLQKLELIRLGPSSTCCYEQKLFEMLEHCTSLRDFSIEAGELGGTPDLLTLLTTNIELRRVHVKGHQTRSVIELMSSIKQLLLKCSKLISFECIMNPERQNFDRINLEAALSRLKSESSRPNVQIGISFCDINCYRRRIGTFHEATQLPDPFFER